MSTPGPTTRSSKQSETVATEAELFALQNQLSERERRIREEQAALEKEKRAHEKNRQTVIKYEDMRRELETLRAETRPRDEPIPETSRRRASSPPLTNSVERCAEPLGFSLKEALDSIPAYDGNNMTPLSFSRACKRARDILPPSSERTFTKLVINKLRGRAYTAIEDEDFVTITDLCNRLKDVFGFSHDIDKYRGELASIFQGSSEHILDFISRVKDLRTAILDSDRRNISTDETNELTLNSFINGLIPRLRVEVRTSRPPTLNRAFDISIHLFKELERDKTRYDRPSRDDKRVHFSESRERTPDRNTIARTTDYNFPRRNLSPYRADYATVTRNAPIAQRYAEPPNRGSWNTAPINNSHGRADPSRYTPPPYRRDIDTRPPPRPQHTNYAPYRQPSQRDEPAPAKICKYCKNFGHDIHECRKREYNNRTASGNGRTFSSAPDLRREAPKSEVHTIEQETEAIESRQ